VEKTSGMIPQNEGGNSQYKSRQVQRVPYKSGSLPGHRGHVERFGLDQTMTGGEKWWGKKKNVAGWARIPQVKFCASRMWNKTKVVPAGGG